MTDLIVNKQILEESYREATRKGGLIDFIKFVRGANGDKQGKYSLKLKDLEHLFSQQLWEESKGATGHRKLINRVTKIVVEYPHHGTLTTGAIQTIFEIVQQHLNTLSNEIFNYKSRQWKTLPDYDQAVENHSAWLSKRRKK